MQGEVKWFSRDKGYGFIVSDRGVDHYFNAREVVGTEPRSGDAVTFTGIEGKKGPRASFVSVCASSQLASSGVAVAFGRWVTTDHTDFTKALIRMPAGLGFKNSVTYVALHFLIALVSIILLSTWVFLLIAYGIPFLLTGEFHSIRVK